MQSSNDADFSTALRSGVMSHRRDAIQQLIGAQLSNQAARMIDGVLADPNALVRRRGAEVLQVLEYSSRVERFLVRMVDDPSWVVREAAVASIGRHITAERIVLISVLIDRSLQDRRCVVRETALNYIRDHLARFDNAVSLFEEYIRTARDSRFAIRCRAVAALSALCQQFPQGVDSLVACADDSHHKVRRAVVMHAFQDREHARRFLPVLVKRWFERKEPIARVSKDALQLQSYETDGLLRLCLTVVLDNSDPESRLEALLGIPGLRTRIGDELQSLCQRRYEWACRVHPTVIEPVGLGSRTLDQQIRTTINVVASMSSKQSEKRRRQQQIWFLSQIFQLLGDGSATAANRTD